MEDKASLKPAQSGDETQEEEAQLKKKTLQFSKLEMLFHASLISCFAHAIKNSKQKRLPSPSAHPDAHTASLGHAAHGRIAPALYGAAIISSHKISTETWRHQKWFNSIWRKKPWLSMCIPPKYQIIRFIQTRDLGEETQWISLMICSLIDYKEHFEKAGI